MEMLVLSILVVLCFGQTFGTEDIRRTGAKKYTDVEYEEMQKLITLGDPWAQFDDTSDAADKKRAESPEEDFFLSEPYVDMFMKTEMASAIQQEIEERRRKRQVGEDVGDVVGTGEDIDVVTTAEAVRFASEDQIRKPQGSGFSGVGGGGRSSFNVANKPGWSNSPSPYAYYSPSYSYTPTSATTYYPTSSTPSYTPAYNPVSYASGGSSSGGTCPGQRSGTCDYKCGYGQVSVSGVCTGGNECCFYSSRATDSGNDQRCEAAGGVCQSTSTCSGLTTSNKCPGNSAVKCCLGGGGGGGGGGFMAVGGGGWGNSPSPQWSPTPRYSPTPRISTPPPAYYAPTPMQSGGGGGGWGSSSSSEVDHRAWLPGPYSQRNCGSCWLWSAYGVLEAQVGKASGSTSYLDKMSVIECQWDRSANNGACSGYHPYDWFTEMVDNDYRAFAGSYSRYTRSVSATTEYDDSRSSRNCRGLKSPNSRKQIQPGKRGSQKYVRISDSSIQSVKSALKTFGPISVYFETGPSSQYPTPVFSHSGSAPWQCVKQISSYSEASPHAVLLVGYDSQNWIVYNSWGTSWGSGGFGRISLAVGCLYTFVHPVSVKMKGFGGANTLNRKRNETVFDEDVPEADQEWDEILEVPLGTAALGEPIPLRELISSIPTAAGFVPLASMESVPTMEVEGRNRTPVALPPLSRSGKLLPLPRRVIVGRCLCSQCHIPKQPHGSRKCAKTGQKRRHQSTPNLASWQTQIERHVPYCARIRLQWVCRTLA